MRYIKIDDVRVDVKDCESCPLNYDGQDCLHPAVRSTIVDYDWDSGIPFPSMCPLREVDETEPMPCVWCNDGTESIRVESKPFLGKTLWRVWCISYPCQVAPFAVYGWSREAAVARWNRKCEKYLAKRWRE